MRRASRHRASGRTSEKYPARRMQTYSRDERSQRAASEKSVKHASTAITTSVAAIATKSVATRPRSR